MELNKKMIRQIFLGVLGCILLYWLLHDTERVRSFISVISGIIAPFVFGGVLAFILNVPMRAIENGLLKKVSNQAAKRALAVVLTFIALLLVVALVFWLLIPQIIETVNALIPNLYDFFMKMQKTTMQFLNENPELLEWLKANTDFENIKWDSLVKDGLAIFGNSVSAILGGAISAIGGIFTGVFNGFIAIVFSVYCLFQKETLARQGRKLLYAFIKEKIADGIVRILRLTNATFSNFLSGQCVEVCILGTLFAISMAIFRMPYVPLISVVIAVTAFIPIVGAWVGCIIGAFLILVENPVLAVLFVAMFLILQLIENNMIYPRVVGTSVGLSGMWVLVAVGVGGGLMGVAGMFLMIPIAAVIQNLLRESINNKLEEKDIDPKKLQPSRRKFRRRLNLKKKTPERKHQNPLKVSSDNKEE